MYIDLSNKIMAAKIRVIVVIAAVVVSSSCTSISGGGRGNRKKVLFCPLMGGVILRL